MNGAVAGIKRKQPVVDRYGQSLDPGCTVEVDGSLFTVLQSTWCGTYVTLQPCQPATGDIPEDDDSCVWGSSNFKVEDVIRVDQEVDPEQQNPKWQCVQVTFCYVGL